MICLAQVLMDDITIRKRKKTNVAFFNNNPKIPYLQGGTFAHKNVAVLLSLKVPCLSSRKKTDCRSATVRLVLPVLFVMNLYVGIVGYAVETRLKVQVRSRGGSGGAHHAYALSLVDNLIFLDICRSEVSVEGGFSVAVVDHHIVAETVAAAAAFGFSEVVGAACVDVDNSAPCCRDDRSFRHSGDTEGFLVIFSVGIGDIVGARRRPCVVCDKGLSGVSDAGF